MTNRLSQSLSPYLLQHQTNPVDWFPWCDEAFELATETDRPIFLSVGYAACHWCHVMEHESFENESIAEYLNKHFVSIKVDREERPDIDQIYMNAVQVMTGHGGWPMSVFLDHNRQPFYAGTYWPPTNRGGMPGFAQVLDAITDAWHSRREEVTQHAGEITSALQQLAAGGEASAADGLPQRDVIDQAISRLMSAWDRHEGGFGSAPKFPHATDLLLLLQKMSSPQSSPPLKEQLAEAVNLTLDKMASGGIRDHIGGGFARYSVDAKWLVPHFEKMLYDNGLLARVYLNTYRATGHQRHADVAAETLDYLVREMTDQAGGFHCSEDADSEGIEGKYYVWNPNEVAEVMGEEAATEFCATYDITERGNFEGSSIPNLVEPLRQDPFGEAREKLRIARDGRVHPGRDDKIVVAWNALAIEALATSAMVLDRQDHGTAAINAANFIFDKMTRPDGRLLHAYRAGTAHLDAYVDDYAFLANACIALYEFNGDVNWIKRAIELCDVVLKHFSDPQGGGFFYTADDAEKLITRTKDWHDGSLVSGNASVARLVWRLHGLTGSEHYRAAALETLIAGSEVLKTQSTAAGALVAVLDQVHQQTNESQWVFAVPGASAMHEVHRLIAKHRGPDVAISWVNESPDESSEIIAINRGKVMIDGDVTWYRCQGKTCDQPIVGMDAIKKQLAS